VHVWAAWLDQPAGRLRGLTTLLSVQEAARAGRFRFPVHRRRYIVRRGLLRQLLGAYLRIPPETVPFSVGPHGKPRLSPPLDSSGLCFNLADAEDLALYAVGRRREVGIDVECVQSLPDMDSLTERCLTATERAALGRARDTDRARVFFTCWTRKEAYLKAIGAGLGGQPLDQLAVPADPDDSCGRPTQGGPAGSGDGWMLHNLAPAPGFVGALAVRGGAVDVAFGWLAGFEAPMVRPASPDA
jgi:4'-phosphopantetheinyl transferase